MRTVASWAAVIAAIVFTIGILNAFWLQSLAEPLSDPLTPAAKFIVQNFDIVILGFDCAFFGAVIFRFVKSKYNILEALIFCTISIPALLVAAALFTRTMPMLGFWYPKIF